MVKIFALIMSNDNYGTRIIENICNRGSPSWIWGIHEFSDVPPIRVLLDEPESLSKYLPGNIPKCDLILSLGLPSSLQALVPTIAEKVGASAAIIAIDNPDWVPPGLKRQIMDELDNIGVAYAFPKPLCSLEETGNPCIDEFAKYFGKPKLEIKAENKIIRHVEVLRGSPCGSTWYIAEKITNFPVEPRERLWDKLAKAHHTYPCLASMQIDPELGDTILHKSQYIIREAIEEALRKKK